MRYLADLHVHSRFSRAVSKSLDLPSLHASGSRKGLELLGTGDFTHPAWRAELEEQLVPAEEGLYRLRDDVAALADDGVPAACRGAVRFVLQAEISTIYKAGDRTRKVHHVILSPSLEGAASLSAALERIGNVASDGRPILGLDSRDLLEVVLETCPGGCLIPAHVWTPWFSVLGSKSGFDSVEECYRDLTDHIFAVETGLSSDPEMNWRVSALDRFALVSNSDAHSAAKLGRECNLFEAPLSYPGMIEALKSRDPSRFIGTVEFFPEEGKYHLDGHRKCGVRMSPEETRAAGGLCPVCGRKVTVGVLYRVLELADRAEGEGPSAGRTGFRRLIGLAEAVGHCLGRGPATKGVARVCDALLEGLGPELFLLESAPTEEVERIAGPVVAEAIRRLRQEEVRWQPGFDGEFGSFELFTAAERDALTRQMTFFDGEPAGTKTKTRAAPKPPAPAKQAPPAPRRAAEEEEEEDTLEPPSTGDPLIDGLGPQQREAVLAPADAPLLVVAGPGSGKTRTLTTRIAHRARAGGLDPGAVLALTFTNRAAEEMRGRLLALLGDEVGSRIGVSTFHALGLHLLRAAGQMRSRIADEPERLAHVRSALGDDEATSRAEARRAADRLSRLKSGATPRAAADPGDLELLAAYDEALTLADCVDLDDLVLRSSELLEGARGAELRAPFRAVFVDEYQDLNPGQVRLLHALVGGGAELTAIGDPDQAIYGFRGADPDRLIHFEEDWPGARVLSLGRSYRSCDTILRAASTVISRAPGRDRQGGGRGLWSGIDGAAHVVTLTSATERAEAERIALAIERLLGGTSHLSFDAGVVDSAAETVAETFSDVAVLYRLRRQGELLAEALGRLGLPVEMAGRSAPMAEAPAVRSTIAALRLAAGRAGSRDQRILRGAPWASEVGLLEGSARSASAEALLDLAVRLVGAEGEEAEEALGPMRRVARHLSPAAPLTRRPDEVPTRPVDVLLDWVALHGEPDLADPRAERISLCTLHAAKGLEWKVVFLAGCEEGLLPYIRPGSKTDFDEERRLFFVGMTRAEQLLVLSWAKERSLHGQRGPTTPCPFIADIDPALLRADHAGLPRRRRPRGKQLDLF